MAKSGSNLLFWLFIVLGTAAIAWMFRDLWMPQPDVAEPPALSEPSEVAEPVRDGPPRHPIEPPSIKSGEPRDTRPLPDLDDSDAYFLLETGLIFGVPFESLLLRDGIIDRFVATVDNLPRAHVSLKIRPAKSLSTPFTVEEDFGNGQLFFLGEENFSRYAASCFFSARKILAATTHWSIRSPTPTSTTLSICIDATTHCFSSRTSDSVIQTHTSMTG
jgi:hypothetical protein